MYCKAKRLANSSRSGVPRLGIWNRRIEARAFGMRPSIVASLSSTTSEGMPSRMGQACHDASRRPFRRAPNAVGRPEARNDEISPWPSPSSISAHYPAVLTLDRVSFQTKLNLRRTAVNPDLSLPRPASKEQTRRRMAMGQALVQGRQGRAVGCREPDQVEVRHLAVAAKPGEVEIGVRDDVGPELD